MKVVRNRVDVTRRAWLAGAAALTAVGCGQAQPRLRIGYQRYGLLVVSRARGRVDAGLDAGVDWVEFPSGPPLLEAMAAGAVDFGATGDTPPIFAQAANAPVRYVAAQRLRGEGVGVLIHRDGPVHKVSDLRGRRVGFTKGSSAHMFIIQALRQAGLSVADIEPAYLAPADAAGAFARRAVDAWVVWDPYFALAEREQGAAVLKTRASTAPSESYYLASQSLVDQAPARVRALLDMLAADAAWGNAHPDEAVRIIARASGLPDEVAAMSFRREPLGVLPITPADVALQQACADTFADLKLIPRRVRVADAVWGGWTAAPAAGV